eukprot:6066214-Amphidinium_carterae.1
MTVWIGLGAVGDQLGAQRETTIVYRLLTLVVLCCFAEVWVKSCLRAHCAVRAARCFTRAFYLAIVAGGKTVGQAFHKAKSADTSLT